MKGFASPFGFSATGPKPFSPIAPMMLVSSVKRSHCGCRSGPNQSQSRIPANDQARYTWRHSIERLSTISRVGAGSPFAKTGPEEPTMAALRSPQSNSRYLCPLSKAFRNRLRCGEREETCQQQSLNLTSQSENGYEKDPMVRSQTKVAEDTSRSDDFVRSASALFAKRGFDRTSVREIAQTLGVASGTLFYHFQTKEDLLEAIIQKGIRDGYSRAAEALGDASAGPLARFVALASAHIEVVHGELRFVHHVWIREWDRLGSKARERMRPAAHKYRDLLDRVLADLQDAGHLRANPTMTRHLMLPALNWTTSWTRVTTRAARRELARNFCAACLNLSLAEFDALLEAECDRT